MRPSITRKIEAAVAALAPDEVVADTGLAWVFADTGRVPKLLRARRRCVAARTAERLVVWPVPPARRQLVGTRPLLAVPLDQLTVERYARARLLAGLRVRTTAGATVVLELTPRARGFGSRLATAIEAVPVPVGAAAATGAATAPGAPPSPAVVPAGPPALARSEVLQVVTDLRDGRLAPPAACAWALAVAGSPVADADVDAIGDVVTRLAATPDAVPPSDPSDPSDPSATPSPAPIDRAQLDAWIARLTER